eukprot:TRINITY_DN89082_c0_g1_i1.p1 TRINITY_DN89082_c0_g1~~TRINITY_DN89082_c0_g1_i1.p1  ORF type:complete len:344 (+),score=59.38 TRINITY_DN89082_c0_g1_i1:93-1124(+)
MTMMMSQPPMGTMGPMGPMGSMPPFGPKNSMRPMGSMRRDNSNYVPGLGAVADSSRGPCGSMMASGHMGYRAGGSMMAAQGSMAPHGGAMLVPATPEYVAAQQEVALRLDSAMAKRAELMQDLNSLTNAEPNATSIEQIAHSHEKSLQVSRKSNLDQIDWRVGRLMYCKDPKYNMGLDPSLALEVQQKKKVDGDAIERSLALEAQTAWSQKLSAAGVEPYVEYVEPQRQYGAQGWTANGALAGQNGAGGYGSASGNYGFGPGVEVKVVKAGLPTTTPNGVPFVEACPSYAPEEDFWGRRLELRTLEEAMHGDVSKPLARPVIFPEDYENYRQGKYVKDDCPIA